MSYSYMYISAAFAVSKPSRYRLGYTLMSRTIATPDNTSYTSTVHCCLRYFNTLRSTATFIESHLQSRIKSKYFPTRTRDQTGPQATNTASCYQWATSVAQHWVPCCLLPGCSPRRTFPDGISSSPFPHCKGKLSFLTLFSNTLSSKRI
jgi:hypothetical protein